MVCQIWRGRPELCCGDANVVLRAASGLLNSYRGARPPLPRRPSDFVLMPPSVCGRVCHCVRRLSAGEMKGPCLCGGGPLSGMSGENTGTCAVKAVWRTSRSGHPAARGSPWGHTCKGAERPRYCPQERTGRLRPHAGWGCMMSHRMDVGYGQTARDQLLLGLGPISQPGRGRGTPRGSPKLHI